MGVLDQIMKMKGQSISDSQIAETLQEQGFSPMQINDALGQAQIKNAVASESYEGMQPSIINQDYNEETEGMYTPQAPPQNQEQSQYPSQSQQPQQNQQPSQEYYQQPGMQQQYYQPQESYSPSMSSGLDTDTIIEIAEQVFLEKSKEMKEQLEQTMEFRIMTQAKIENLAIRLKKIESLIDQLQISILGKVGSYTQGIDGIKKEMSMMQDSFGKLVDGMRRTKKE